MFIDKFMYLCKQKGVRPSIALDNIGMARSNLSKWKKWKADGLEGKTPFDSSLLSIAEYFDVPVEYFSEEAPEEKEKASALNEKVEAIMKVYDMLTPENKERFSDSLSEILSALIKEQLQG